MQSHENKGFTDIVRGTFDAYGRQMPMTETLGLWWKLMLPYDLKSFAAAMGQYVATEPKFPPTPAQILGLLGQGNGDDRPGADEAWAIALQSQDEAVTVVWTQETAEAFLVCRPVLNVGDEIGARMAFRQAYDRLVTKARQQRVPARWVPSLGWDLTLRSQALANAVTAGLLPAPHAAGLLPPPEPVATEMTAVDREEIDKIKRMLAQAMTPGQKRQRDREDAARGERERLDALKQETDAKVRRHLDGAGNSEVAV